MKLHRMAKKLKPKSKRTENSENMKYGSSRNGHGKERQHMD
jgi:hypothetical protein